MKSQLTFKDCCYCCSWVYSQKKANMNDLYYSRFPFKRTCTFAVAKTCVFVTSCLIIISLLLMREA